MTRLALKHKKDIEALLAVPRRYCELRQVLETATGGASYRGLASLEKAVKLHRLELKTETGLATLIYSSVAPEKWDPYHVAQALYPNGYFCNLTSVYYHDLTNQVPLRIYMAVEGSRVKDQRRQGPAVLTDEAIFDAFVQPHRVTRHNYRFQQLEITITERVDHHGIGVEEVTRNHRICPKGSRVTSLERTLIDAVVQPQYNGGLGTVVETFRNGLPRINQRRFLDLYEGLAYVYPYWQAIGFLCARLNAPGMAAAIAGRFKLKNKFYLDHGAKTSWAFDPQWQIYYPKGAL